jgi:hypothetical protein
MYTNLYRKFTSVKNGKTGVDGAKSFGRYESRGKGEMYEDPDNDSDYCVTVTGIRPDNVPATDRPATDAGTDEGNGDYCAGER